MISPYI